MFNKILVATDLSVASERLARTLDGLKNLGAKEALLLHCLNIHEVGSLVDSLIRQAQPELDRQAEILRQMGFDVVAQTVVGPAHTMINKLAVEQDCSLIVIGSQGQTMATDIMLGGVANAVTQSARLPVLIIRMRLLDEFKGPDIKNVASSFDPLEHILFPTDFSENSEEVFKCVADIASFGAKRVTLLHVQDKIRLDPYLVFQLDEFNRIDRERMEKMKEELNKRGVEDVRIELPFGSPKKEIIDRTERDGVSFVVMGSQGRGFLAELFLGSVSHAVARRSKTPVLIIPKRREK